jgi:hypothetical protein
MTAILTGEFQRLAVARETELKNFELTDASIKAYKNQKFINWALIIGTALAAVMPFVAERCNK